MMTVNATPRRSDSTVATSVLGAAMLLLAITGCRKGDAKAAETDGAPGGTAATAPAMTIGPENVAIVTRGPLASGPAISGALRAEREATLRAEASGAVLATLVEPGTRVRRGQLLVRIDDSAVRDAFLGARSGVTTAEQTFELARREQERSQSLAAAGAIAERDLDVARRNVTAATAALADSRARLALANRQLAGTRVTAPFDGVVSDRQVKAGDVVGMGTALLTVVDPRSMRLEASVPASSLSEVRIGAPVSFTVNGYAERSFTGTVTSVNPVADPTTGQVRITVGLPNSGGTLVGGLFAEGRVASTSRIALTVPLNAVDARGLSPVAYRLKGGRVEKVEISLGARDEDAERVEVAVGLAAGDSVLTGAAQGISVGTRVMVSTPGDTKKGLGNRD